jgi:hypothetical protein
VRCCLLIWLNLFSYRSSINMIRFMEDPNMEVLHSSLDLLHLNWRASTWMWIKTPLDLHLDSVEQGTLP